MPYRLIKENMLIATIPDFVLSLSSFFTRSLVSYKVKITPTITEKLKNTKSVSKEAIWYSQNSHLEGFVMVNLCQYVHVVFFAPVDSFFVTIETFFKNFF